MPFELDKKDSMFTTDGAIVQTDIGALRATEHHTEALPAVAGRRSWISTPSLSTRQAAP